VLQHWATVAGTVSALGARAHYAEAQAKLAKKDVGYQVGKSKLRNLYEL
jgi:hypothetical protein